MATRTTRSELRMTVTMLAARGYDVAIHWAYGRPRVTSANGASDISPRLSTGEMRLWLAGFEAADRLRTLGTPLAR